MVLSILTSVIQDNVGKLPSEIPTLEEQGSKTASKLGQKEEENRPKYGKILI